MRANDVSIYLIAKSNIVGDSITNKRLQKLLYYVKAWGLVYFPGVGVIDENFEAWVHGPVCPTIYRTYKNFGFNPIVIFATEDEAQNAIDNFKKSCTNADMADMIDAVFDKYGQLTSLQLELLSHQERPWIEAREGLSPIENGSRIINPTTMFNYYSNI